MSDGFTKKQIKARGGWRPNAGRKKLVTLRTTFLSSRTTPDIKRKIEERCIRDQITESQLIHQAVEKYLSRR